jgi:hypothetical protein
VIEYCSPTRPTPGTRLPRYAPWAVSRLAYECGLVQPRG